MKALKLLLVLIGLLVILVAGVLVYLATNLNSIVERIVESEGSTLTQTEVTLDEANIRLRDGRGELKNLVVANPPAFDAPNALVAEQLVLQLEIFSVTDDVVIINELVIDGVTVTAEQKGLTTNVQALLKSIQQATEPKEAPKEEREVRLMVEKVRFSNNVLNVVTEDRGDYTVDLPGLELSNLGDREQGLTPAELGRAIVEPLLKQAKTAAQDRLKDRARDKAKEKLEEEARERLGDDVGEKIRGLRDKLQ